MAKNATRQGTNKQVEKLESLGAVMVEIARALKPLRPAQRIRVMRAVAALHGFDLPPAKASPDAS